MTYFLSPQDAETFPDLKLRASKLLTKLADIYHQDDSILLVTHGDFGKMIYASYYDLDWENVLTDFHFGNSDLLLLSKDSPANDPHIFKIDQYNT